LAAIRCLDAAQVIASFISGGARFAIKKNVFGHEGGLALSSQPGVSDAASVQSRPQVPQIMSLGWALRRAALWLVMMTAMVTVGAWLFYASIDPDEAAAGPVTSEQTPQTK
jgi:hypothetical protein